MIIPNSTHPLGWKFLEEQVIQSGLEDPGIWIEDLRRYGPTIVNGIPIEPELTAEDTDIVEASFALIFDKAKNLVIIRHHY